MHSDLNPKNLLVDPDTLEVTGLLDWEFAHAGHPCTDLGNLLRFDRDPAFADAVLAAYAARHGGAPGDALDRARAADLWALVDLAARRGENPVADRAHERAARAIARDAGPAAVDRGTAGAAPVGRATRAAAYPCDAAPEVCLGPRRSGLSLAISPRALRPDITIGSETGLLRAPARLHPSKESLPL